MYQLFKWLLRLILFVGLFGIALHNTGNVSFHFYLGYQKELPLILLLLFAFLAGILLTLLAGLPSKLRQQQARKRQIESDKMQIQQNSADNTPTYPY